MKSQQDGAGFYMIRNWTNHQHYKNKRPTWIKVYTALLTDMKFRSMCDSSKLLLFHLWLLAATNGNKIRLEMCNLRSITGISNRKLSAHELIENKYLVPYDSRLALDGVYTREEKRREEKKPQTPLTPGTIQFDYFWAAYPRKVGKGAARKAWYKIKPGAELVTVILEAIDQQKKSEQWQKDNGQFIPHPATWLNQERWTDSVEIENSPAEQDSVNPRDQWRDPDGVIWERRAIEKMVEEGRVGPATLEKLRYDRLEWGWELQTKEES